MNHKKRRHGAPTRHRPYAGSFEAGRTTRADDRQAPHGTWIYGTHAVMAALANPERDCHRLMLTKEAAEGLDERLTAVRAARKDLPQSEIVPRETLTARLGTDAVHQGIALLAGLPPERDLGDICRIAGMRPKAAVVVLDQVEDPRNIGAILRSAAAFGALAVIVTERHAPQTTAVLAKAASGALEIVPLVRVTNLVRAIDELKQAGFWVAGFDAEAETSLEAAQMATKTALVLGAEGTGLRRLTREHCDFLLRIPMAQAGASLNVSNAAAIALYAFAAARPGAL